MQIIAPLAARLSFRAAFFGLIFLFVTGIEIADAQETSNGLDSKQRPNPLPLPSSMPLAEFEEQVFQFLQSREYENLGWLRDKGIRPTGPYIQNRSYNNHPAVRIYYSPGFMRWLAAGRKGAIPQNAMIIKEMHNAPADQYYIDSTLSYRNEDLVQSTVDAGFSAWTIMIRDTAGAHDGWYWGYISGNPAYQKPDTNMFEYPDQGFGQYCTRCHASAADNLTFSSLTNIEGFDGNPLTYTNDGSWNDLRTRRHAELMSSHKQIYEIDEIYSNQLDIFARVSSLQAHAEFVRQISAGNRPPAFKDVVPIPPVGYDHVVAHNFNDQQFITSDQCLGCHSGFEAVTGWEMFNVADKDTANLSPYGEWRWSMMGLAGRDPVFFAQQESERVLQPTRADEITNLCFHCHGVMGQRQFRRDTDSSELFREEFVFATPQTDPAHATYGALARDGISCLVCHQMVDDGNKTIFPIETGDFHVGSADTLHGPYEMVAAHAMEESLGITPVYNPYIKSSRVCGSCHTVHLPVFNARGEQVGDRYEQTTYLEWLNSAYSDEGKAKDVTPKSCQNCHMPQTYHGKKLQFQVATIEDQDYPAADHLAPMENITVRNRKDYSRHTLLGVNVFVMEMFQQFNGILGVRLSDYMSGRADGLQRAIKNADEQAKQETAELTITELKHNSDKSIDVNIRVQNLVGHKFPSGVGFRRAFLRVELVDKQKEQVLWASGRSNAVGVIVDENDKPLPSEFFETVNGRQVYEPHYELISRQNQVQIYQELARNPEGRFTTSFVAIDEVPKDNRLLPRGWSKNGPSHELTEPEGRAADDPLYNNGSGADEITYRIPLPAGGGNNLEVRAALFYQSIPPFYLRDRFTTAKDGKRAIDGDDTQRLLYLTSHIDYSDTPADGWVLLIDEVKKDL